MMRTLSRMALCLLIAACFASLAQAKTHNLYTGNMNGAVGFGVSIPFAGVHTEVGGPTQSPNIRGNGVRGPVNASPGTAFVTTGGAFTLPPGDFFITTSYVNPSPTTPTFQYSGSSAMLNNDLGGSFAPGFFTGAFGTSNTATVTGVSYYGGAPGQAIFHPGGGFGGVMRLAGTFVNILTIQTTGLFLSTARVPLTPTWLGGSDVPQVATNFPVLNNSYWGPLTLPLKFSGFPWITGKVTLIQNYGAVVSLLTEIGTNQRTLSVPSPGKVVANGRMKMVTGYMMHWLFVDDNVGEFELKLNFLPEPSSATLLGAGVLLIAAVYRVRRRSA